WEAGGTLAVSDTLEIDVYFSSPCTDISLLDPGPGWVFNETKSAMYNDSLSMMLGEFSINMNEDETITAIGAEYREVGTEGWTEIVRVDAENIPLDGQGDPGSVTVFWDVSSGINDGVYELCAFSFCEPGGRVRSPAVMGVIDKQKPEVLSLEPADDIMALGDQIVITFNEEIDCDTVNGNTAKVVIEEIGDDTPVTSSLVCNGTSIVITPTSPLISDMEGKTLIAEVSGIKDVAGNTLDGTVSWSFEVRRSEFTWSNSSIFKDAPYSDPGTMTGTLVNGSEEDLTFSLTSLPEWLTPDITGATVVAGQSLDIEFTLADTLSIASHVDTLYAEVPSEGLTSQLVVRVVITCQPPAWAVNAAGYQHSMTAIIELSIDGAISTDENDVVAAFVGNEVRGVAY
ncbi:MAG: Ig-like domain-containing protein, partial [bacterium]|nr:Ig-like domain-containing protein [bacterium]